MTIKHGDNVDFRTYLVERQMPIEGLSAVEAVVDVSLRFALPVGKVWPAFKDWNSWMSRYGYRWTANPADEENNIVYLESTTGTDFGTGIPYLVRRVIPEHLIYLESLQQPLATGNGFWTGHNVASLREEGEETRITVYMEHTFLSQELSVEELRQIASELMFEKGGIGFWREYFVPDLESLLADV
jgi:hypothetical protein